MEFSSSITDILKLHRSILTDLQKRLGSSQGSITLTTSGSSGASTLIGNSLNIPVYSGGGTTSWGSITGTLASQTDLNTALLAKVTGNASITGATKTKITYDSKGLVTSGADATTADIADSLNKRYVTDAQQTIIGNTSGTNTGNNATNSQYSGLAASKQDTLVSGTNIKTINSTTLLGNGNITTGSVTSVGVSMPTAFTVTNSPIISSGTIAITGAGTTSQYIKGDGSLGTTITKTSELTNDGDNGISHFISLEDLPANLVLYPTNVASSISGYYKLVSSITDPDYNTVAVNIPTGTITGSNQFIAALVTAPNLIVGNPGIFNITTVGNIQKLSGTGNAEFYFEIYKRTAGGTETLICTSGSTLPVVNSGYAQFSASALWNNGVFLATDMIVMKFYGTHIAGGSNPSFQFQFGGGDPVRTGVPLPLIVIPSGTVTSVGGTGTVSGLSLSGSVTTSGNLTLGGTLSLTSGNVTTALGFTPYNATNPNGYTTNVGTVTSVATGTGLTGGTITGSGTISFSTAAIGTWAATPSSANLAAAMTDETGSGSLVFGTSPTFTNSITVNGSTISGYNTTPLQGAIKDGVTSILGDLNTWTTGCYQGTVLYSETSSTTIAFGQLCYRTNAGQWGLADATSFAASAYYMLGICLKTTTGPSQPTSILINGFVESTYVADFKVGEPQYMATTAGSMTKSAPASSGNIVRIIGNTFWTTALQTNAKCVLHFNPDKTWIELT